MFSTSQCAKQETIGDQFTGMYLKMGCGDGNGLDGPDELTKKNKPKNMFTCTRRLSRLTRPAHHADVDKQGLHDFLIWCQSAECTCAYDNRQHKLQSTQT